MRHLTAEEKLLVKDKAVMKKASEIFDVIRATNYATISKKNENLFEMCEREYVPIKAVNLVEEMHDYKGDIEVKGSNTPIEKDAPNRKQAKPRTKTKNAPSSTAWSAW